MQSSFLFELALSRLFLSVSPLSLFLHLPLLPSFHPFSSIPSIYLRLQPPANLQFLTFLARDVRYRGKHRRLQGYVDNSLFIGHHNDQESNLVVLEAKRLGDFGKGDAQVLTYLGKSIR